ncbi:MAG: hypothetical protein FWC17_07225 [Treponema sp.]|nr:hypothetical protein [Treponema sp.]
MIGFLIKKSFYDLWDNLFKIVVLNLGFFACSAIPVFLPRLGALFTDSFILDISLTAVGILICAVYLSAASRVVRSISEYSTFTFKEFLRAFKTAWPAGLVMGLFVFILFLIITIIIPFYLSFESPLLGLALAAVIFWSAIFALLSFQFYFTVTIRLGPGISKSLKKSMLICLDNTGLAFFMIINNLVALVLSVFFAFMFPGPAGILLYLDEALRLRLLKYDYLEENPEADRRKIPWDALLIEERERTGSRTFRNFIFPWKD